MTRQRSAGLALVLIFLAAHLALLPKTLEDLDSVNFALGVRQFDIARHQPHPPGYPVYIALAKASTAALRVAGIDGASSRGLAIWSALGGAAAIPAVYLLFRRLEGRDTLATWATLVLATSPLFWFTALRPLSDMLGFAAVMWTLALVAGRPSTRALAAGALVAGLAVGIRSQTAAVTLPFLAIALARHGDLRVAAGAAGACGIGVIAWAVPMLVASGGPGAYLRALSFQAGADFGGTHMLWVSRTARAAAQGLFDTFIWPWDWWLGLAVCALAAAGAVRITWRAPRVAIVLLVTFGPYAIFHLLFQETVTIRYALPLLPVMAYAAMAAVEGLPGRALPAAALGLAAISLMTALPASMHYAREGAPIFRAFDDMAATAHGGDRVDAIALHAKARRPAEWAAPIFPARLLLGTHGAEWLRLVELWKDEPSARVWYAADPWRTDFELFDPRARDLARAYRWGFVTPPFVGGARPDDVDWYRMQPPNWMLDRGWSITAEVGGVTARDKLGPQAAPAVAWLRRQAGETTVLLGGRHIGAGTSEVRLALNGRPLEPFQAPGGYFFRVFALPAGALAGAPGYIPLAVTSVGHVSLEQFDAQPPGVPMVGYDTGWYEPEFDPGTGQSWRWTSERADLWVRAIGRPVTLRISGENPRRYFDATPHVRVLIGDREIDAFDPDGDFERTVTLPADALDAAKGRVTVDTSKFFVPGGAGGGGDRRHLSLRIYRVSVD